MLRSLLLLPCAVQGLQLVPAGSPPTARTIARAPQPAMLDFDMSYVVGVGALAVGLGGGIALISFTEGAGQRNDEAENAQPCVVCKGVQVTPCTVCNGTGEDQYASLVAGVRDKVCNFRLMRR